MAFVDPLHARDLFEWIDLNLAPGACADPLVPSVDDYYSALGLIARTAYARNRREAMNFLELYAWRAHLPSEMPAVARAFHRFRGDIEAAYLEGSAADSSGAPTDPPGFSSAALDIISRVTDLQIADAAIGVTGSIAMDALRTYLLAQLKAPRCADNVTATITPSTFNAALRRARADSTSSRSRPTPPAASTVGVAQIDMYLAVGRRRPPARRCGAAAGTGSGGLPLRVRRTRSGATRRIGCSPTSNNGAA